MSVSVSVHVIFMRRQTKFREKRMSEAAWNEKTKKENIGSRNNSNEKGKEEEMLLIFIVRKEWA